MIEVIGEHSVRTDLLTGGIAIDIGCLGWEFSKGMRDLGCEVHAFDLIHLEDKPAGVYFSVAAITDKDEKVKVLNTKDRQAWHINGKGGIIVDSISLNKLYKFFEGQLVDVLKLDCEGSEYDILSDPAFRPIARQISVEFHYHCHKSKHERLYAKCMENLEKYYVPVRHEWDERHGSGLNLWDSCFVRKDLLP